MEQQNLKNSAVPTPFGWVLVSAHKFDLDEVVAFQSQLSNLSRALGASETRVSSATPVSDGVLAPLTAA